MHPLNSFPKDVYLAGSSVYDSQILFKFFTQGEIHDVIPEGAKCSDYDMITIHYKLLLWTQKYNYLPQSNI